MESKIEKAVEKKKSGKYNCAQAVACTYCDTAGIDESVMQNITNSFGTGMGNLEGTCGALVGAGVIVGLKAGDRVRALTAMREIMSKFKARNGSVVCKDLKGIETKMPLRQCNDCVADACEFLEEYLNR